MAEKKMTAPPKKRAAPVKKTEPKTRAMAVEQLLIKVENKLAKDMKATLGDYIKLIQLSKAMTDEPKGDIKVTWIEEPLIDI
ncbi:MAG: hypothetical protein ABSF12_20780 [Bryobacteraceae bacterium]